ncbi:MAG: ATPase [Gammaproteobacteria bacterium]|nr:ATPase [Gammaproteobacteria bacterium]
MFRAEPMLRVTLWGLASESAEIAALLARHGLFNPRPDSSRLFSETTAARYRETFHEAESRYTKIIESCGENAGRSAAADALAPNQMQLDALNERLKDIWQACLKITEAEAQITAERKHLDTLGETQQRLKSLNIDLAKLLKPGKLLDVRLGSVPSAHVKRLRESLAIAGYMISVFQQNQDTAFNVITGPRQGGGEIDAVLSSAGWRSLMIPPELMAHPSDAEQRLNDEFARLAEAEADLRRQRDALWQGSLESLSQAAQQLALARPLAEVSVEGLKERGQLVQLTGWVPRSGLPLLEDALEKRFSGRTILAARKPGAEPQSRIPTLLRQPAWLGHFSQIVKSYGVPRYGEFDPSALFALAYVVLFGSMFGDVGHGSVLLIGALFLRGKLAFLRTIGVAAAVSAILFGFLYGSVFGFETLIEPLWQSPMHEPVRLLLLAVQVGIGFIVVTQLINIYNLISFGRFPEAVFLPGGIAGLVLYAGAVAGLFSLVRHGEFGLLNLLMAGAGLLAIAAYAWYDSRAPFGERLLVVIIESLEAMISLFSNTLSFLRVAAFSLNHVALALAVFTLASGLSGAGHWLMIVFGNVVVIVLEGGIVAIQALRLMYYEGFSRFYNGDGREFKPLRLRQSPESMGQS